MTKQQLKRRANILYRLRKKGIRVHTKDRTIFYHAGDGGGNPLSMLQISQLVEEYRFLIQFEL
jgi:hypothetical protein